MTLQSLADLSLKDFFREWNKAEARSDALMFSQPDSEAAAAARREVLAFREEADRRVREWPK